MLGQEGLAPPWRQDQGPYESCEGAHCCATESQSVPGHGGWSVPGVRGQGLMINGTKAIVPFCCDSGQGKSDSDSQVRGGGPGQLRGACWPTALNTQGEASENSRPGCTPGVTTSVSKQALGLGCVK